MPKIININLKSFNKIQPSYVHNLKLLPLDKVIVKTPNGLEVGIVNNIDPKEVHQNVLNEIVRKITYKDELIIEENSKLELKALKIFKEKIKEYKLDMKAINVYYLFDKTKIIFYFYSQDRVDFRNLVKNLASIFKARIELRQIGIRDKAKYIGGLGICGRTLCCKTFLNDFYPVSVKMAKDQNISLNPSKISGACGRLMCCLQYENEFYKELNYLPKKGDIVKTIDGNGVVVETDAIKREVVVEIDINNMIVPKSYNADKVTILKKSQDNINEISDELKNLEKD